MQILNELTKTSYYLNVYIPCFSPLKASVRKQGHISIINGIGKEGKGLEWFIFNFIFSEKL